MYSVFGLTMNRPLLAWLAFVLACPSGFAQAHAGTIILRGARLIDGTGHPPIEDAILVVQSGRIRAAGKEGSVQVPKGEVRDVRGKTIIPALIDLHTHLGLTRNGMESTPGTYSAENIQTQLENFLRYGVGTIAVMGTDQPMIYQLRDEQRAGKLAGARFYTAGRGFGMAGGLPAAGIAQPLDIYRPKSTEEARTDVRELASHHPDFVKIWVDDDFGRLPKIPPEIYRAIIDEAHHHNLRVIAHVFYLADAKGLVAAGIDGLGHSVRDLPVDRELIEAMKGRGVFYVPTLVRDESTFAYAEGPRWLSDPFFQAGLGPGVLAKLESPEFKKKVAQNPDLSKYRAAFETGERNLKTMFESGVTVGMGTDAGPPLRFQGYLEHRELQLMVESGVTPLRAIVAATGSAARILGATADFGTLEVGKRADFLVLDANPLEDIHNTEKLEGVWQSGRPIEPIRPR
jgi:imidazolonepropionase-like amidohydrolase